MSITEDHKELEIYEIGYSILTSVSEDKLDDVVTKIKKAVTDVGGAPLDSEAPFQQELAYPMSKTVGARKYVAEEAYIGWMKFECAPENTPTIKTSLDKIEEVLRFLLIKATRETLFTYEGARLAIAEKEAEERGENNDGSAEGVPKATEEAESGNTVTPTLEQ